MLQGYALRAIRPDVAAQLLRRAILLDEPDQTARAGLYLGTALAYLNDFDGAIAALEDAIEAQARHPMHRTAAPLDQALLIALAQRVDLYDLALERINCETMLPLDEQLLTAAIAGTLILDAQGMVVSNQAKAVLATLDALTGDCSELSGYIPVDTIRRRLSAIASR